MSWGSVPLSTVINDARKQVEEWATTVSDDLTGVVAKHRAASSACTDRLKELVALETASREELATISAEHEAVLHSIRQSDEESNTVRTQKGEATSEAAILQASVNDQIYANEKLQREMADEMELYSKSTEELSNKISMYTERFGLDLSNKGGNSTFTFSCLDPENPKRQFTCTLQPNEGVYSAQCEPSIEGLEQLLTALNQTGDLGSFLRDTRKKFAALITSTPTSSP
ncbi:kinetochore protein Spc25 [Pelomyxa schiedti]|nr:kinetochore protein Spc25 [Pelomyxa schiedti]